nr:uncharacterized protein LOC112545880 [Pelodiscus sinensis]XP_025040734.1 uncharacterized protein LOC112545880 [Pelodiscus sinensis]|eukprot:XP_025040733.1 uncharacterized protein LOC112545880 [Pelodiscus sinensis]
MFFPSVCLSQHLYQKKELLTLCSNRGSSRCVSLWILYSGCWCILAPVTRDFSSSFCCAAHTLWHSLVPLVSIRRVRGAAPSAPSVPTLVEHGTPNQGKKGESWCTHVDTHLEEPPLLHKVFSASWIHEEARHGDGVCAVQDEELRHDSGRGDCVEVEKCIDPLLSFCGETKGREEAPSAAKNGREGTEEAALCTHQPDSNSMRERHSACEADTARKISSRRHKDTLVPRVEHSWGHYSKKNPSFVWVFET